MCCKSSAILTSSIAPATFPVIRIAATENSSVAFLESLPNCMYDLSALYPLPAICGTAQRYGIATARITSSSLSRR